MLQIFQKNNWEEVKMKKIKFVGLVGILSLSLCVTSKAFAETDSTELESSSAQTIETSTSESSLEESSASSTSEEPVPDTSIPFTSSKTEKLDASSTGSITEINLSSVITAFHEKGDKISAIGFQVGIENSLNKKLTNYRFETGEDFIADTVGIHTTKILADLDGETTYLITCSYSVQNNVNTIPAPQLSYDAENHVLNGKTLPNHKINFYKVGLASGEEFNEISTVADEHGNFSISADKFERGRLMAAIVSSPDGLEFSDATQFKIPLADTTQSTTESTNSSEAQTSESTTDSAKPKPANGKALPSTGEENDTTLKASGMLAFLGAFSMFLVKKRNVNK